MAPGASAGASRRRHGRRGRIVARRRQVRVGGRLASDGPRVAAPAHHPHGQSASDHFDRVGARRAVIVAGDGFGAPLLLLPLLLGLDLGDLIGVFVGRRRRVHVVLDGADATQEGPQRRAQPARRVSAAARLVQQARLALTRAAIFGRVALDAVRVAGRLSVAEVGTVPAPANAYEI